MSMMGLMITAGTMATLLMTMSILISKSMMTSKYTSTPFQCGFNPMTQPHKPFSIQFFLIAILFLVFDIELVLLLPIPLTLTKLTKEMTTCSLIIFVLTIGLMWEWAEGCLTWS